MRRFALPQKALPALVIAAALAFAGAPIAGAQSTYYLSPRGSDIVGRGTEASPWATLGRINALDLKPGDRVLLEGGAAFAGTLYLGPEDGGTAAAPVTIGSYGGGRATIYAGEGTGLLFHNGGGFRVSDLVIKGSGGASPSDHGIVFYNDVGGGAKLEHVRVDRVHVEGFNGHGLAVIGAAGRSGYRDVRVTNSAFYENGGGITMYGPDGERAAIEDLYIGHCRLFGNAGGPGPGYADGSGSAAGAASVAVRDAADVTVQHNESYGNGAGGFSFGDVRAATVQHNYSHGNAGAGFGFGPSAAPGSGSSTVRFNVSENDRGGALAVEGAGGVDAYHNTFFVDAATGASVAVVVGGSAQRVRVRNSIIAAWGGAAPVRYVGGAGAPEVLFQGNGYWSDGPLGVRWGGEVFDGLAAWRAATGQEVHAATATGLHADPRLTSPGRGGTVGDAERLGTLAAYELRPDSPFLAAGLDLPTLFGTELGSADFFGNALAGRPFYSIGAHQAAGGRAGGGITTRPPVLQQEVVLRRGWNLVARWVEPSDVRFDVLLGEALPKVELVRSGANTVYARSGGEVGRWETAGAYRIYASKPVRFTIAGAAVTPEAVPLALSAGWNDVPYLLRDPMPVEEAMASIAASVVMVKDSAGGVYYPEHGINTIGLLQPGQGYQVRLSRDAELVYPPNVAPAP